MDPHELLKILRDFDLRWVTDAEEAALLSREIRKLEAALFDRWNSLLENKRKVAFEHMDAQLRAVGL